MTGVQTCALPISVLRNQIAGALVATIGLVIIGVSKLQGGVGAAFLLVLLAAFFWAAGNTVAKHVARIARGGCG